VVCLTETAKILLAPCGHVCLCNRCSTSITVCPKC